MKLKPHAASDRAFVWTTLADFADEEAKQELLAIRLKNAEGKNLTPVRLLYDANLSWISTLYEGTSLFYCSYS